MLSKLKIIALVIALASVLARISSAALTFYVDPGSPWPAGWYDAAVANMQTTVNMYNAYGDFTLNNSGSIYVYYNAGIPTAQGSYNGSIGIGGTYPNVRVLLHESSHWLGTGTYSAYWSGPNAGALMQQFDGIGAVLNGDAAHYWPYGENYDTESSPINDARHIAMVYALRKDFGIGSTAPPSSATTVTLTASDATGTSGFNYPWGWSDGHFPQAGTNYYTGDFALRTPNGYPSWTFAGASLTVNNHTNPNGGLLFNGYGTAGIVTINNLILDGGTIKHDQYPQDLFQLAGKITLASASTINAAQGNIRILADIGGSGSMTKTGAYTLTLTGRGTYSGSTTISGGVLQLASVMPVASYTFDNVSGSTVVNGGTGGTGMNGTLAGGATIVAGGQSGNAVSVAGGASVDINSPITDLGPNGNWTVSAWVKTSTLGASILTKGNGGWSSGNTIIYLGDGTAGGSGGIPSAVRWGGGFFQGSTSATAVNNNAWHQVTYVNNGGSYAIYVDGVVQSLSAGNSSLANGDVGSLVRLGVSTNTVAGDGTVNFNGLLDNVQFYSQALSAAQVSTLYQGSNAFGTLPSGTNVTIASGATLDLNGAVQQIGSLAGGAGSAVTLGAGQLAVNSSVNTRFDGIISGSGGSLVKQGTGVLTLTGANMYTGTTTISQGTLKLGALPISAAHRWSFNSSLADSVGTSPATIVDVGANNVSLSATQVTLAGGARASSDYVSLGSNLLPKANVPFTIELWATPNSINNWSRIFDSGSDTNENLFMSWTQGTNLASDRVEWKDSATNTADNTNQPYTLGTKFHIAMVLKPVGNSIQVTWYSAPAGNANLGAARGTFTSTNTLTNFIDSAVNLGRSFYSGDDTAGASYDEVRFWNAALDSAALETLHDAGPDANFSSLNLGSSVGQLPSTTAVNISASGATLDLNGFNQTIGSLTGVSGSQVILGSGALTIGGDNASTTFAGSMSGSGGALIKAGAGTFSLFGANTYTGPTTVSGGTLRVNGSIAGAVTVNSGAVLGGTGSVGDLATISNGGTLAPGSSPGALTVGSLNLNAGSQLQIELGGATRGSQYDAVLSGGNVILAGALNVSLINSFAPVLGNNFDILDWGSESGVFSNVNLPALPAGLAWNTTKLYTVGALSVIDANYLPGDVDRDGHVTVADVSAMASALADLNAYQAVSGPGGGALTNEQLTQILDLNGDTQVSNSDIQGLINYLATGGGSGGSSTTVVPEPRSLALAVIGALSIICCVPRAKQIYRRE